MHEKGLQRCVATHLKKFQIYNLLVNKLVTSAGVKALVKILNWSRAPLNDLAHVSAP